MKRSTQRLLPNLSIFACLLCFILYVNRPQLSNKDFAWTEVRYRTNSAAFPEARGVCPGLADSSKPALIVARVAADGDPKWLEPLTKRYHLCVYTADAPLDTNSVHLQVPANHGHEAMAYLTFLIDNYAHIPASGAVFVHGSQRAWHNDEPNYDNVALLTLLNISAAVEPFGYHNLRCDWSLSTCSPSLPPQGSLETSMRSMMEPWNARVASDMALPHALMSIFGGVGHKMAKSNENIRLDRAHALRSQCCAQFVVARGSLWQHTRDEYIALRQWILDGTNNSGVGNNIAAPADDRVNGRIVSYIWHILFMRRDSGRGINLERLNSMACQNAEKCYCRLYGRCGLTKCTYDRCPGQYYLPPDLQVPHDRNITQSQQSNHNFKTPNNHD